MSDPKVRVASGSQEGAVHRRAEQEAPREIPIPSTSEALAARNDSLQQSSPKSYCLHLTFSLPFIFVCGSWRL